ATRGSCLCFCCCFHSERVTSFLAKKAAGSSALEVVADAERFLETGKDANLPCSFKSPDTVSSATSVSWSFQPEGSDVRPQTFFYYSDGKAYNGKNTQFEGRTSWIGNFTANDVSIKVTNMQPTDNGTYFCDVKNPPDIISEPKPIEVRVVEIQMTTTTTISGTSTSTTLEIISLSNIPVSSFLLQFCCILASCMGCS
uniref:Ig-like domain-containing protein n=1 Tax=Salvator merianae TaxID=96440 RepID=A0A8D0B540_SALMN